jgi:hypothetical protein
MSIIIAVAVWKINILVKCHKLPLNVFEIFEHELRTFNSILHGLFLLRLRVERYEINKTTGFENVLL